jgi:hypothetical protein
MRQKAKCMAKNKKSKKIVVIANKTWEADPLIGVILHEKVRPKIFTDFSFPNYPAKPREPNIADPYSGPLIQTKKRV